MAPGRIQEHNSLSDDEQSDLNGVQTTALALVQNAVATQPLTNGILPNSQRPTLLPLATQPGQAQLTGTGTDSPELEQDEEEHVDETEEASARDDAPATTTGTVPAAPSAVVVFRQAAAQQSREHWLLTTALGALRRHTPSYPSDSATLRDIASDGPNGFPALRFPDMHFRDLLRESTTEVSRQYKDLYESVLAGLETLLDLQEQMEGVSSDDVSMMNLGERVILVYDCEETLQTMGEGLLAIDERVNCLGPFSRGGMAVDDEEGEREEEGSTE